MFDCSAHDTLGLTTGVGFGGVKEVDASVESGFEAGESVLVTHMSSVSDLVSVAIGKSVFVTNM